MDLEQALAAERVRADTAEKSAQRASDEAKWVLQTAQAGPETAARNEELEQEVEQLRRANAVLLQDSAALASLQDRVMELESRNRELAATNTELSVDLRAAAPKPGEATGNGEGAAARPGSGKDTDISRTAMAGSPTAAGSRNAGAGTYGLHLASYRSLDQLGSGWQQLQTLYPELLRGLGAISVVLDIPGMGGTYHRLIAGPVADELAASGLCEALKARREYCVVAEFDPDRERIE